MKRAVMSPKQCAKILRAMGDETRLRILKSLLCGDKCVGELVETLETSQPHVSHHLRILREAGLVEGIREGQRIWYRLMPGVQEHRRANRDDTFDFGCCRILFPESASAAEDR